MKIDAHLHRVKRTVTDVDKRLATWAQAAGKPRTAGAFPVPIPWATSWQPVMNLQTT
jgi:hypothetical protein